jgi:hypothetical protein
MVKASNSKKASPKKAQPKPATQKVGKVGKSDKPKQRQLEWGSNAQWTHSAIEYLTSNVKFRQKLFSDSTSAANAEGRTNVQASESKTALYQQLANAIFTDVKVVGHDEELQKDYVSDPVHFGKSTQQQFQRFDVLNLDYLCIDSDQPFIATD